jgi:hypothetical protein
VLQFLPVESRVAAYTVQLWEREPARSLDIAYLESLGPHAWQALARVAVSPKNNIELKGTANTYLIKMAQYLRTGAPEKWRSWQGREAAQRAWLLNWVAGEPEK